MGFKKQEAGEGQPEINNTDLEELRPKFLLPPAPAVCLLISGAAGLDWRQRYLCSTIARTARDGRVLCHGIRRAHAIGLDPSRIYPGKL